MVDLAPGGGEESARAWRGASRFKFIATHSSLRPPHLLLGRVRRDWQRPQTAIKDVRRESARFWAMIRRACGREHAMQTVDLRIAVPRHTPREPPSHERHQRRSSNTQVGEIRPPRGLHASRGSHSAARRLPPRPAPKNSSLAPPLSSRYVAATRVHRPSPPARCPLWTRRPASRLP